MSNTQDEGILPGQPTKASTWKKKAQEGTLIRVPSGNTALVRTPGIEIFIKKGIIPNSLLPLVHSFMSVAGSPTAKDDLSQIANNPEKIEEMLELADVIITYCCMDPIVVATPIDENGKSLPIGHPKRDDDTLYVDEVDVNDKLFIMNFAVGGAAADGEKFRNEV
jgi:hypothetical protein